MSGSDEPVIYIGDTIIDRSNALFCAYLNQAKRYYKFAADLNHIKGIAESSKLPLIHAICKVKNVKLQIPMEDIRKNVEEISTVHVNYLQSVLEDACNSAAPDSEVKYEPNFSMPEADRYVEPISNYMNYVINERFNILSDKISRMSKDDIVAEVERLDKSMNNLLMDLTDFAGFHMHQYCNNLKLFMFQKIHERLAHVMNNPEEDVNTMDMTDFNKIAREIDDMDNPSVNIKYSELRDRIDETVGAAIPIDITEGTDVFKYKIPERVSAEELEHSNIKELVHKLYVYEYYPSEMFELTVDRVYLDKYREEHEPNYKSKYVEEDSPRVKELKSVFKIEGDLKVPHKDVLLHGRINTSVFFEHINLKELANILIKEALERKSAEEEERKNVWCWDESCKECCCKKECCKNEKCKNECCCKNEKCKKECCKRECCKNEKYKNEKCKRECCKNKHCRCNRK